MKLIKKLLFIILITIAIVFISKNIVKASTVEVTTDILKLREKPSTESSVLALIAKGEKCEFISEEDDWYKVKYEDYTGYISKEYSKKSDENSESNANNSNKTENEEEKNNDTENSKDAETEEINQSVLKGKMKKESNVKIVPLINSSTIKKLNSNTEVTVIEQINNWLYIQTDEISGWVINTDISVEEIKDNKNDTDKEDTETIEEIKEQNSNEDENKNNSEFEEKTMYTNDYVNIRKEPNTTSDILMLVEINTELKVIGEEGNWYKVSTSEGDAYVSKDLLSNKKVNLTNRGNVDRISANKEETKSESDTIEIEEKETSSTTAFQIVSYAKKFLGVPYVYGGASSSGFDCSGFTMYVYKHFGISMGHGAQMQSKLGKAVNANKNSKSSLLNNLEIGDLVFFLDYETMDEIGHCGIYIGDGDFIHASSGSGYCVKINSLLPGEYYNTRYCAARRII